MKIKLLEFCLIFGLVTVFAQEASENNKKEVALNDKLDNKNVELEKTEDNIEASKDKRQIDGKQTNNYANNHRSSNDNIENAEEDDPENPHETIYSAKSQQQPQQFLIRPEQSGLAHPTPTYVPLRNYPATLRPHNTQLLEQSQEIQHFSYLHEINRNQPKSLAGKSAHHTLGKRPLGVGRALTATAAAYRHALPEEAEEQRYEAFAPLLQQQQQHNPQRQQIYINAQQQQQQQLQHQKQPHPQQQQQQQYEIIPEQQFLKLLETELRARAYYEAQLRQQQHMQHQQQHQQHQQQLATNIKDIQEQNNELDRQRYEEKQQDLQHQQQANYVQYVTKVKQQQKHQEQQLQQAQDSLTELPPQIAYYQPQISYKTLPNHPLAKSSLEKEIEKLLAANKPSAAAIEIIDNSNEPSAVVHRHHQPPQPPQPQAAPPLPITVGPTVPTLSTLPYRLNKSQQQQQQSRHLLDANNQPFVPSLFQFSDNLQTVTPIYPTRVPQHIVDAKKLGPVVYPAQTTPTTPLPTAPASRATSPAQPTQYYYQDTVQPTAHKPKAYRYKQPYGLKIVTPTPALKHSKYLFGRAPFFPSPQDPIKQQQPQLEQIVQPSQSSNYLLQNNNNNNNNNHRHGPTPTPKHTQPQQSKTLADLQKLHLPQPGGKPLTQAQFQALVDAGYPVTAVPVPVPVPYEQYIKDHPEFEGQRHQPPTVQLADYMQQFMRALSHHQQEQRQHHNHQRNNLAGGPTGEPSVKIVSSPTEGSITFLRPIAEEQRQRQKSTNDNSN